MEVLKLEESRFTISNRQQCPGCISAVQSSDSLRERRAPVFKPGINVFDEIVLCYTGFTLFVCIVLYCKHAVAQLDLSFFFSIFLGNFN